MRGMLDPGRRLGLTFGLFAGLMYVLAAYGRDAVVLQGVAADHFWWKLSLGLLIFPLLCALAGWLTALFDSSLAGILVWILAGVGMGWLSGHLPFEGLSALAGLLDPRFRGLEVYPFTQAAQIRTGLTLLFLGGAGALGGVLQPTFQDLASGAASSIGRWLALGVWTVLFIAAGVAMDGEIHAPLRAPLVAADRLFKDVLDARTHPVDPKVAADKHLAAARTMEALLPAPRRLVLGSYDAFSMVSVTVETDFSGQWARCTIIAEQPSLCQPTDTIYRRFLTCLLQAGAEAGCNLTVEQAASRWLAEDHPELGPVPAVAVLAVRGAVTLVEVRGPIGAVFTCRFRGASPVVFETCYAGLAPPG